MEILAPQFLQIYYGFLIYFLYPFFSRFLGVIVSIPDNKGISVFPSQRSEDFV